MDFSSVDCGIYLEDSIACIYRNLSKFSCFYYSLSHFHN